MDPSLPLTYLVSSKFSKATQHQNAFGKDLMERERLGHTQAMIAGTPKMIAATPATMVGPCTDS